MGNFHRENSVGKMGGGDRSWGRGRGRGGKREGEGQGRGREGEWKGQGEGRGAGRRRGREEGGAKTRGASPSQEQLIESPASAQCHSPLKGNMASLGHQ